MPTPQEPPDEGQPVTSVYRLVGIDPPTLRRGDLEAATGVERDRSLRWWRAMGFPEVDDDDLAFREEDVEIVTRLEQLISSGTIDDGHVIRLAQLMGASFTRLVDAQLDTIEEALAAQLPGSSIEERWGHLPELADLGTDVFSFVENAMAYVWRRHLVAALGQRLRVEEEATEECVGFADLSGFSRVSKEVGPEELAEIIETFETIAFDVVPTHRGRVVKLIGDEVMFVTTDVDDGVAICIDLITRLSAVDLMPPVHCGLAWGPTITVAGDVFGPTVNLASRLTGIARPDSIALPRKDGSDLLERDDLDVRKVRRPYDLKGVGRTSILAVRPPAPALSG